MSDTPSNDKSTGVALLFNTARRPMYTEPQPKTPDNRMDVDPIVPARVQFKSPIIEPSPIPHRQPRIPSPDIEVGPIRTMSPRFTRHKSAKLLRQPQPSSSDLVKPLRPPQPSSSDFEEFPPTPDIPTSDAPAHTVTPPPEEFNTPEPKWPVAKMPAYLDEDSDVSMDETQPTEPVNDAERLDAVDIVNPVDDPKPVDSPNLAGVANPADIENPLLATQSPTTAHPSTSRPITYAQMSMRAGKSRVAETRPSFNAGALIEEDRPFPTPEQPAPGHTFSGGKPGAYMRKERVARYLDNFIDWSQQIRENMEDVKIRAGNPAATHLLAAHANIRADHKRSVERLDYILTARQTVKSAIHKLDDCIQFSDMNM